MTADPFSPHMEAVARKVLGEPNAQLSSKRELRFGSHGSLAVDLEKGVWHDHEANEGGGVVALLASKKQLKGVEAVDWLKREVGAEFEERRPTERAKIVATYDYADEAGEVLYQVVRLDPKDFRQRRPQGEGWAWGVKGVRLIPYRLIEVVKALARGETIYITEGEKDADNLAREGLCTSCNAMGAGKWTDDLSIHFTHADVVILPHNDEAGRKHAQVVGASLQGHARSVRVLELPDLGPKGDVSDWLGLGGDRAELERLVATRARPWTPQAAEPPESRFGAIPWAELDHVEVRQDWLIADMMFCGDVGMCYGASGSGKSFLMTHAGLCIARGVPFLGHDTRKGGVIYQAGEGGKGLVKRLRAYKQEHRAFEDVPFVLLPARVNLFASDGDAEAFIAECLAWKAVMTEPLSLIVIDTFSTASPGANENASEDMSRLISAGEAISKATGAALMWVHHKNAAGDRERGHTSLRANIDTAIEVTKDEETSIRTLRLAKLKDGDDGLKLAFDLQTVTLGAYDDGKPITSCVVVPAQAQERTSHRRPLPRGQKRFLKTLDTAISQYGGVIPGTSAYGVQWEAFRDLFVTACGQGMTPAAVRQTLSRDGNDLWLAGLIERQDHWLWITDKGGIYL
jgi:hypothetical protein